MDLIFVKRSGKNDELTIVRDGAATDTIACPKQGILPHDMVHYAVESVLAHRGFLSLVKAGGDAGFAAAAGVGDAAAEAVERLVETMQAEMWGGRVPIADLIAVYEQACDARGHRAVPVTPDDIVTIRARIDALVHQWAAVPTNGSLVVRI